MLNDINNTTLVQEWKLNLDSAACEENYAKAYIPSDKKETDLHDRKTYWPIIIKETIQWFHFISNI